MSTAITILFKPYFGGIFDKWGYRWPVLISLLISSIMLIMMTRVSNIWQLLIVYTITTSAIYICFIATTGATSNTATPAQRGMAMGVLGMYISSGRALSSIILAPILGILEDQSGSRSQGLHDLFVITAFLIFSFTIILGIISYYLKKRNNSTE